MKRTNKLAIPLMALGLSFAVSQAHAQEDTVNLSALLGVTGPIASIDVPAAAGFRMAVQHINDAGGITVDGKKYRLIADVIDIQGRPDQAVGMARKIVSDGKSAVVVGPVASSVAVPSIEATQPNIVQVTMSSVAQQFVGKEGKEYLFSSINPQFGETGTNPKFVEWVVENVLKKQNITKIAVLIPNDSLGQLYSDFFPAEFRKHGIEITGLEMYEPKANDFSALITKLKAGNPEALFWGYLDEAGKSIIRQSIELGLTRKFISAPGPSGGAVIAQADKIDFAIWPSVAMSIYNPAPKMREFVAAYEKQEGRPIAPGDAFALYLYDPTFMVAKAMEAAGSTTDPKKIADALKGMTYSGVMNYSVDAKGQFHSDWDIGQMERGGNITWTTINVD